ncbi:MAG: TonB family protein [Candidatus Riflebacteria bacterium]|nr:TonB family protein [Candidatus Riflebacteria bacterium]
MENSQARVITLRPEDGSEEFKASLLLHLALLMFLTAWYALRGFDPPRPPPVFPVRLVGPLSVPKPGSGVLPRPEAGSRLAKGEATRLAKGRPQPDQRRTPPATKAAKPKSPAKVKPARTPGSGANRPGQKPAAEVVQPAVVQDTPVGFRESKPFVPSPVFDDVSHALAEPTPATPMTAPLAGGEMGEPLELDLPGDTLAAPSPAGSGDQDGAPSGTPGADAPPGGGEVEIGGIESLGGGEERFAPPKILTRVLPEYPEWARRQGVRGQATYKVLVQEAGTVGDVVTMASTIDPKLAITGAQALRRWVFSPVLVNGEPRETWVMLTVQFKLN